MDQDICICLVVILVLTVFFIILILIWKRDYGSEEGVLKRLKKELKREGFKVKEIGQTGGNSKRDFEMNAYRSIPIYYTIHGGAFEDVMEKEYEAKVEEVEVIDEDEEHIDTLQDVKLSPEYTNARLMHPDEYVLNQARPLMHLDVKHMHVNDYVWLDKTDGVREMYKENDCILDCERYDGKLYCFDALVVNGVDVRNRPYEERMDAAKNVKLSDIIVKEYYPVESIEELITYIENNEKSPKTGQIIDGVILQERKKTYNYAKVYKLKLPIMNTIDFRLKHVDGNHFVLYSGGKFINNSSLQFSYPNIENCSLFVAPYYANAHKFTVKELPEKNYYPSNIVPEIKEMTKMIMENPASFDGRIVELSWDGSNYYPMRIRTDKLYPNGYRTAISNIGLVYAPITIENKYFENDKGNPFSEETIGRFHENSHMVRKEIMNKLPELPKEVKRGSCIDLSCGRGGDLKALMDKGYRNLFCVDLDKIALTQLVNKLYEGDFYRHTWVNVFDYDLSTEMDTLYNRITERKDYSPGHCFQLIFMNFAIHYVIENAPEINKFVRRLIKPGGYFAFTFFDGDKILADNGLKEKVTGGQENIDEYNQDAMEGGASKKKTKGGAIHNVRGVRNTRKTVGRVDVDIDKSTGKPEMETIYVGDGTKGKDYSNKAHLYGDCTIEPFKKDGEWWVKFPLPTIAASGYREEPLVLREKLKCFGNDFTEYANLSNDPYFGLLRLRVYKY